MSATTIIYVYSTRKTYVLVQYEYGIRLRWSQMRSWRDRSWGPAAKHPRLRESHRQRCNEDLCRSRSHVGGTGPSDDAWGRSQPLVLKDEGKTGGEDLIREFCGAMRTSCWCARPRSHQSRAEPDSSPPPWINSRLPWRHHRRGAAALRCSCWRWCSLPPALPRKVQLLSPGFFLEPFGASLSRVWTQSAQVVHAGPLRQLVVAGFRGV